MLTAAGTTLLNSRRSQTNTSDGIGAPLSTATGTAIDDGTILDTLVYMAPEQVQGRSD